MSKRAPIFLAIDTDDIDVAAAWVQATSDFVAGFKIGLEFFATFGSGGVEKIKDLTDAQLFLDLKLHDIPNTVAGATRAISKLQPRFLTVHASGGSAMVAAAVNAGPNIDIAAVTILTSLSAADLTDIGFQSTPLDAAVSLAGLAVSAGAKAIICSPLEVAAIRAAVGPNISIITPGVRPISEEITDDQQRTMDPKSAISAGASYLVIGRPITSAWVDGSDALRERAAFIAAQLN